MADNSNSNPKTQPKNINWNEACARLLLARAKYDLMYHSYYGAGENRALQACLKPAVDYVEGMIGE